QDRWRAGCHNAAQLHREIGAQGDTGSDALLVDALRPWRPPRPSRAECAGRRDRRYRLRRPCLTPPGRLTAEDRAVLDRVLAGDPALASGYQLLQRFRALIAERDLPALDAWLADARASAVPGFVALANSITADRAAVDAALT